MKITKKEVREVEMTDDVLCNRCGESCKSPVLGHIEAVTIHNVFGYGSPRDNEMHEAHLCELCYEILISTFKIPPTIA